MFTPPGPGATGRRAAVRRRPSGWAAAGSALFAAGLVGAALLMDVGAAPAALPVAPVFVPAAAVTTASGPITLIVDPATELDPAGGSIQINGSGFDGAQQLVVAVCAADGAAPASLTNCVGGAIPNDNQTWGYVTATGANAPQGNAVSAKFGPGGGFVLTLNVPTSGSLDCAVTACAVYTRYVTGNEGTVSVPLSYSQPTTSTSSSPTPTFSSVLAPKTVPPRTISSSVQVGGKQHVLFTGFTPGEKVDVTLFSRQVDLPGETADGDGVVTIDFTLPKSLGVGPHTVQAVGEESRTIGLGRFLVTAPPTTSKTTTSSSTVSSTATTSSSAPSSSTPTSSVESTTAASSTPSSAATSAAVAPVTTAGNGSGSTGTGSKPIWPWVVLGGVILLWIIAAIVFWWLRRQRIAAENEQRDRRLAEAAAAEEARQASGAAGGGSYPPDLMEDILGPGRIRPDGPESTEQPPGYRSDDFGLLSGREEDGHHQLLLGQSGHTAPTNRIGPPRPSPMPGSPGAPTQGVPPYPQTGGLAIPPAGPPAPGPATGQSYGGPQAPVAPAADPTVSLPPGGAPTPPSVDPTALGGPPTVPPAAVPAEASEAESVSGPSTTAQPAGPADPAGPVEPEAERPEAAVDPEAAESPGGTETETENDGPRRRRYRDDDDDPSVRTQTWQPPFDTGPQPGRHSR